MVGAGGNLSGRAGGILLHKVIRSFHQMVEICVSLRLQLRRFPSALPASERFRGVNRRTDHIVTFAAMVLKLRFDELQRDTEKSKLGIILTTRRTKMMFLVSCFPILPIPVACQASESATVSHCNFHQDSCSQSSLKPQHPRRFFCPSIDHLA